MMQNAHKPTEWGLQIETRDGETLYDGKWPFPPTVGDEIDFRDGTGKIWTVLSRRHYYDALVTLVIIVE